MGMNDVIVPEPTSKVMLEYLDKWDTTPIYIAQEHALNKLFSITYPQNKDINEILIKVSTLNDFYSTNIFSVFHVAERIYRLDVDERLHAADPTLVHDIASVTILDKTRNFYSFASKYCSHHRPEDYPIYDSYVDAVLRYFRKTDHFAQFSNHDLKHYPTFKSILLSFRTYYDLTQYGVKDLDRYLWLLGKEFFPKIY